MSSMTPDDMEAVVARLEKAAVDPVPWSDLRALLLAYHERGRALEPFAVACEAEVYPNDSDTSKLAVRIGFLRQARATLKGESQ